MSKAQAYFAGLKDKKVAVVGIGVSNTPLIQLLVKKGAKVTACDRNTPEKLGDIYHQLVDMGVEVFAGEDYLDHFDHEIIFKTPGLRCDVPQLVKAKEAGATLTSEMEVFFELCPCPIFGVTGSDGKTTTTSIICEMLKAQGYTCHIGGNIGKPLLPEVETMKETDVAVVELSSFQLHTMTHSPKVAVITNVAPNHLDWHTGMEEYIEAKKHLMAYQSAEDRVVLNLENDITRDFMKDAKGQCLAFSSKQKVQQGFYLRGEEIVCAMEGKETPVMNIHDIRIVGMHNVENYMAAMSAVYGYVDVDNMITVAKTFAGVEHRIEFVREVKGVKYYNDSIASSPTRTLAGLHAFTKKVILIAGGYDKKIPFDGLGEEIPSHVKVLILTGATSQKIKEAVLKAKDYEEGKPVIIECANMDEAVAAAAKVAQEGDVVTLSPACAAFDAFKNFAVRGRYYKELVNRL